MCDEHTPKVRVRSKRTGREYLLPKGQEIAMTIAERLMAASDLSGIDAPPLERLLKHILWLRKHRKVEPPLYEMKMVFTPVDETSPGGSNKKTTH